MIKENEALMNSFRYIVDDIQELQYCVKTYIDQLEQQIIILNKRIEELERNRSML